MTKSDIARISSEDFIQSLLKQRQLDASGTIPAGSTITFANSLVEFMRALTSDDVLRRAQTAKPQPRLPVSQ